jgi:hypothetical protein
MIKIAFYVPSPLLRELETEARQAGISLSRCVRNRIVRQSPPVSEPNDGVPTFRGGDAYTAAALAEQHRRWFEQECAR